MKRDEGLYRSFRFLRQIVIGAAVFLAGLLAFGYLFFVRGVDEPAALRDAHRELTGSVLRYGEQVVREAHVYQRRSTNYFRGANGVLAATPERIIFVGVAPANNLESEDAPPNILQQEFRNDTLLTMAPRRLYANLASGVVVRRLGRSESYAADAAAADSLRALMRYVAASHEAQRLAAAEERKLRRDVAAMLARPLRYVVAPGDALSTIATRFGATPEQVRQWNGMTTDRVRVRDTLLVKPAGARR